MKPTGTIDPEKRTVTVRATSFQFTLTVGIQDKKTKNAHTRLDYIDQFGIETIHTSERYEGVFKTLVMMLKAESQSKDTVKEINTGFFLNLMFNCLFPALRAFDIDPDEELNQRLMESL